MNEEEIKVYISKLLGQIQNGYVEGILRSIIFSYKNNIDWKNVLEIIKCDNPEIKGDFILYNSIDEWAAKITQELKGYAYIQLIYPDIPNYKNTSRWRMCDNQNTVKRMFELTVNEKGNVIDIDSWNSL